jgi:hypothetical protein
MPFHPASPLPVPAQPPISLPGDELADQAPISGPLGKYRWVICGLLFFATTINYVDRQILSLLKPMLDEQLGWTSTQFGAINSAFQAAYGVSLFGFGWLIDKYGTKLGYALSIAAGSRFGWLDWRVFCGADCVGAGGRREFPGGDQSDRPMVSEKGTRPGDQPL